MKLRQATLSDFESILVLYEDVTERTPQMDLDDLATNTPAHRIYERLGFKYRGKQRLYAENTGWIDFFFYEYNDRHLNG